MPERIRVGETEIEYEVRRHPRARRTKVTIHPGGRVVLTLPMRTSEIYGYRFLKSQVPWILKNMEKMKVREPSPFPQDRASYIKYKPLALELTQERVEYFAKVYGVKYRSVRVRDQKTLWGSCSRTGILHFNYRIVFLEPDLVDYLVVHEVCHLKQFNHSPRFWDLVEESIPNYKKLRTKLRKLGIGVG